MKVLHVTPSYFPAFVYGGPIRSTHQMNLGLAARGVEVRVLTTDANGRDRLKESGKTVESAPGLTVEYAPRTFLPDVSLSFLWRLPSAIAWADVVHITAVYSFSTIPALAWSALLDKPVFWSPRGALQEWAGSPKRGLKAVWDATCRLVAGRKTTIIAASEREAAAARVRFPKMQVSIVENGVTIPENVMHKSGQQLRLLFLGRLHPIKGIENLLEACALLNGPGGIDFRLRLAGPVDPVYREDLHRRVERLGLSEKVQFIGSIDESAKAELFCASDILVLPSHSENFGIVVAEALAHGVPVIASRNTPWQRVEAMECGLWRENDASSLATAVRELATKDLEQMGRKGRAWMQAEFTWERQVPKMQALYEGAMTSKDGR